MQYSAQVRNLKKYKSLVKCSYSMDLKQELNAHQIALTVRLLPFRFRVVRKQVLNVEIGPLHMVL